MPSLARKVLIAAAVDGLFIQPLSSKKDQRPASPVKIRYEDATISIASRDTVLDLSQQNSSFEAFGVVGMSLAPLGSSDPDLFSLATAPLILPQA